MTSNFRSEARSVILRLRRYRDRMQEIAAAAAGVAGGSATVVQRQLRSLKTDLDHDVHECAIGRKRMKQTECEQEFLWPALREAADAICGDRGPAAVDTRSEQGLCSAQGRIQHYLTALEGRWPTL